MQAYFLWEKHGRPWGEEEAFWFQAERILWDRIEAKQWRDEEEVQAVANKVAATTKPGSSRAKAKASTKQSEASAPTEKKNKRIARKKASSKASSTPTKTTSTQKKAAAAKTTAKAKKPAKASASKRTR